ncbi:putative receptor-like protein kinase [Vitis vinifera]|uniref:Putative receptor-like protein kinase n=1 Tax=Vitis vinifera TaxID=29760 RepID=A0A438DCV0_VITVI|nr:putative receptor-like protein kinase [Vitis vinifera]
MGLNRKAFTVSSSSSLTTPTKPPNFSHMDLPIRKFRLLLLAWLHPHRSGIHLTSNSSLISFHIHALLGSGGNCEEKGIEIQVSGLCLFDSLRNGEFKPCVLCEALLIQGYKEGNGWFRRISYSNSYGVAYKAIFQDGLVALVKEVRDFNQGKDIFYGEVQRLGRLHHRHLLALRGFSTGRKRFLVFESIENGSLKEHLNDPLKTPLNWRTRLQIAIGVAAALEYLQLFNEPPIYHVSIRSSNILLDENFTAKLADVGVLSSGGNHATAQNVSCSKGQEGNNIIFQLGVLILELITGQSSEKGGVDLIQWVQESRLSRSMQKMIDPDLGNSYDSRELNNLLAVARLCIKSGEKPTFSIPQIFRYLQKKVDIPRD